MRNLALFILFLIGLFYVRRALRGGLGQGGRKPAGDAPEGAPATPRSEVQDFEQMVACAHCGLHVPESEGVRGGSSFYCCDEHRRLGPRQ
ncbi:MAG: PP0621 family protein [Zoogloea sp.]|uniref:PP0621 family protein n=1 Tax=Zoogloea sp. TaxID=49181 RepID=UPI00263740C4|nr:PP0621 family protein [Zoogloea sp.]MDD3328093.1 PP0621 family protein [Zoogloea sp.]